MENHNIDSLFRKAINESQDFYDSQANKSKERIWTNIPLQKQPKPLLFRLLVAACILLFIGTSLLSISNFRAQKTINTLVESNGLLRNKATINIKNASINNQSTLAADVQTTDTVYVEKEVIVAKPVTTIKHITDTVYIQQLVYVEKEQAPDSIIALENRPPVDSLIHNAPVLYETEIVISNNGPLEKKKRKKFQFKFGGNKDHKNSGTIALTSKL